MWLFCRERWSHLPRIKTQPFYCSVLILFRDHFSVVVSLNSLSQYALFFVRLRFVALFRILPNEIKVINWLLFPLWGKNRGRKPSRIKGPYVKHTVMYWYNKEKINVGQIRVSSELAQGLDTDKINPYIEKCFGIKKPLLTVSSRGLVGSYHLLQVRTVQLNRDISYSHGKWKTV